MTDVSKFFSRPNPVVIGGDFNGHHPMWEKTHSPTKQEKPFSNRS
jgi:hypothetical protein